MAEAIEVRAAVCREFGAPLSLETLTLAPPEAGEVRVRVDACAICHSDITYMDGGWGGTLPAVFGHEVAGTVTDIGPAVRAGDIQPGDAVLATLLRSCGRCECCETGLPHQCLAEFGIDSAPRLSDPEGNPVRAGLRVGGFAESIVVDSSQLVRIPPGIPPGTACLVSCGVLTGFGAAVNTADVRTGDAIAVVGCGGVGLNCVQGAALAGAHPLVAVDVSDDKLGQAEALGATATVRGDRGDFVEAARALTDGRGFDAVLVAVGRADMISRSVGMLARGGALVSVGMPPDDDPVALDATALSDRHGRLLGCKMGGSRLRVDAPRLFRLLQAGRLELDVLVTSRGPLDEINGPIGLARKSQGLRHVIEFPA